jgi:hypothetical protein
MIKSNLEPIEESDLDLKAKLEKGAGIGFARQQETPFAVEQEKVREISAAEKDDAYGKILSKVQSQSDDATDPEVVFSDAQAGAEKMDAESRVQHLIDLAQQKGVVHAVKVARHMQDNYVLDSMHDRLLAQDLHDALVAKGMIEEL